MITPYYQEDGITIYNARCEDVLPQLDNRVSCAVTSPPYNVEMEYDVHDDKMEWNRYSEMATTVSIMLHRLLCDGGRVWVNVVPVIAVERIPAGDHSGRGTQKRINLLSLWSDALEDAGLPIHDIVSWPTPGRGPGTAWGSYESPAAPNLRGEWESILVHYKGSWARRTPQEWHGWKDDLGGWPQLVTNVWKMQPEARGAKTGFHPAPFPDDLPSRIIRLSTWPDETVLDPFFGSGTTAVACKRLGRKFVGTEKSEKYCEIAVNRLRQMELFTL